MRVLFFAFQQRVPKTRSSDFGRCCDHGGTQVTWSASYSNVLCIHLNGSHAYDEQSSWQDRIYNNTTVNLRRIATVFAASYSFAARFQRRISHQNQDLRLLARQSNPQRGTWRRRHAMYTSQCGNGRSWDTERPMYRTRGKSHFERLGRNLVCLRYRSLLKPPTPTVLPPCAEEVLAHDSKLVQRPVTVDRRDKPAAARIGVHAVMLNFTSHRANKSSWLDRCF